MMNKENLTYQELANTTLEDAGLSIGTMNRLYACGIYTLADVLTRTDDELLSIRYFGQKNLNELHSIIDSYENKEIHTGMKDTEIMTIGMNSEEKNQFIKKYTSELLSKTIEETSLGNDIAEELRKHNITRVSDLVKFTKSDLLSIKNMPRYICREVNDFFEHSGTALKLGMTDEDINTLSILAENESSNQLESNNEEEQIVILHEEISNLEAEKRAKEERLAVLNQLLEQKKQLKAQNKSLDQQIAEVENKLGIGNEMKISGISR